MIASWQIADGHYLYRDKVKILSEDASRQTGELTTSAGEKKPDEFFGDIEVYHYQEKTKKYIHLGGFYETGPIAINQQILPLEEDLAAT